MKNEEMNEKMLEELKANLENRKKYIYRKEFEFGIITFITFLVCTCLFYLSIFLQNSFIFTRAIVVLGVVGVVEFIIFAYYFIVGVLIKQKYKYISRGFNPTFYPGYIHFNQHEIIREVESEEEEYKRLNKQNEIKQFNTDINTNVINKILESFGKEYIYIPDNGIEKQVVEDAEFEDFDVYYTNDLIEGKFKNCTINIAEILTDYNATKKNIHGNIETYKYIFTGIFAHIEMPKKFNTALYTRKKSKKYSNLKEKNIKKLSFKELKRNRDFRRLKRRFNIYTLDNDAAIELLRPDVIEILINFLKKTKINYELTIKNNNIYIRFENVNTTMFEIEKEKDIYILYEIIKFIQSLIDKLVKE